MHPEYPELTVSALTPATATLLRNGEPIRDLHQRVMELEYENGCLKQAMSELMMEKLVLKVALEARYQPAQRDSVLALTHEAARNLSQSARNSSIFVGPAILGTQLRATYDELVTAPMPDPIAEFIEELEKGERPTKQSFIGHVFAALAPRRFSRSGR